MVNKAPNYIYLLPELEWTKLLDSSEFNSDSGIAYKRGLDGYIYIVGLKSGDLDGQTNSGQEDVFIIKLTDNSS